MKSVTSTCHENSVIAPPVAVLRVASGTTNVAVSPGEPVNWFGSVDARTVPGVEVCHSWNVAPSVPGSWSAIGAYRYTALSPIVVGVDAAQSVTGDVVIPVGCFGGWL